MSKKTSYYKLIIIIPAYLLLCCNEPGNKSNKVGPAVLIFAPDSSIHFLNGVIFYNAAPFSGEIKELWPNRRIKSIQRLVNGKEEGLSETFYNNGSVESRRWYVKGEKDSVHTGWWENGNKKYEYHFKMGSYSGWFTEWYKSGKMIQQLMYEKGKELYGKGWRESGKLYMNFVISNGRRYGLNNSNLCYGLKQESVVQK